MSTENIETPVEPVTEDLDAFASELFGQSKEAPEPASSEVEETVEQESDAPEDETQTDETDTLETDEETPETDETPEEEETQPKKETRAEKRIRELNTKLREAERREQATAQRLEEIERKLTEPKNETPKPATNEAQGPTPADTNEDGTEKYPLGEFDPSYIRDLTKFTLEQEVARRKAEDSQKEIEQQYANEKAQLQEKWSEKLGPAQERYPDFQEKGEQLFDTFAGIDQKYGEYLSATLMSMDFGPDVLYYLANNLDVANKIVASGPTRATIALGRLEAKFADAEAEKNKARPKVSNAPVPPETLKGSTAVMPEVPDDTDDLDAFSRKLFKKKK